MVHPGLAFLLLAAAPPEAALGILAGAPAKGAELVALPLRTVDVDARVGLEAWQVVVAELEKAKRRLEVSTALQKKQHDFLVGPAREQARDCVDNAECLAEVGATLGVDILVTGKIDKTAAHLQALDVKTGKRLAEGRSGQAQIRQVPKNKARVATQALVKALLDKRKQELAAAQAAEPKAQAEPKASDPKRGQVEVKPGKPGSSAGQVTAKPSGPPQTGAESLKLDDGPPVPAARLSEGSIAIAKESLSGVTRVSVDGEVVPFSGDGSIAWSGAPGSHRLVAVRLDGRQLGQDVVVQPGEVTTVRLEFPAIEAAAPPPADGGERNGEVTSRWWFWTALGAAVVAGSATAFLLAGGEKGGPSLPAETGTLRGSY